MRHIRAMDDQEKAERRQQILSCAADWFDSHSFEQISMQQVAQHCGMAKGTLYLYFSTREEVFLALLEEEFVLWFNALSARLSEINMADKSERMLAFSHALTSSLAQRPRLLRLIPLLHSVLEQNIPRAAALRFKRLLMSNLQSIGVEVENRLGFLRPGQGAQLLLAVYAQLVGLQSMALVSPALRDILEEPDMEIFRIDLMQSLGQVIHRLMDGYFLDNMRKQ